MKSIVLFIILLTGCVLGSSCKKDWLDAKSDISKIVPTTMEDMRLLLNNSNLSLNYLTMGELSSDNVYLPPTVFASSSNLDRNIYTWQADIFQGSSTVLQWNNSYNKIFITNIVLEGLEKINPGPGQKSEWDNFKGRALFFRANAFYELVTLFSKPFTPATAAADPGIPLRLRSDINAPTVRSSLQESYDQIISDLQQALGLLALVPANKMEASKPAANALLARVYLAMGDYDRALQYANNGLEQYSTLIDYNTLNAGSTNPLVQFNEETIFFARNALLTAISNSRVEPSLYDAFHANDLRKAAFFKSNNDGTYTFKGSYAGSTLLFGGAATNELYLIRAECNARKGKGEEAMEDINTLLVKRYKTGTFIPLSASNADQALDIVLLERRKELVFTTLRWQDLRRLNQDPKFAITLTRTINSQTYTLPPNDKRYTFPIPDYIIASAGIAQNPR